MTPNQLTLFHAALRLLCRHFKVTPEQIESRSQFAGGRDRDVWGKTRPDFVLPRQMLMFYAKHIGIRTTNIAALLNRCSGDVCYSCRAFKNRLDTEKRVREVWEWLEASI